MREKAQSYGGGGVPPSAALGPMYIWVPQLCPVSESIPNNLRETQLWYVDDYVRVRPFTDDDN